MQFTTFYCQFYCLFVSLTTSKTNSIYNKIVCNTIFFLIALGLRIDAPLVSPICVAIVVNWKGGLHLKPPKFEHIFVSVITFHSFLLCR